MAEINTKKILDGITLALRAEFPQRQVFDDEIRQDLRPGAFNVILVSSSQRQIVGERYRKVPLFDVLYYPHCGREECLEIADRLSMLLNVISLPGGELIRGSGMEFEIVDGVLHFYVQYTHYILRESDKDAMDDLKLIQGG